MTKSREQREKPSLAYRFVRWNVRTFYRRYTCEGVENIPSEPVVFVGNHCQLHGPISAELYMPVERYTWCQSEMMDRREVPAYAFEDFWSQKSKRTHWFYRICAYLITPLSVLIFNNADTIPVYNDRRVTKTLKRSVELMEQGKSIVIFPEHDERHDRILDDFRGGFSDVARLWYKRTGKAAAFVPMYVAPYLKKLVFGEPLRFDPDADVMEERERIRTVMMERITALAEAQPLHTVVPYRNIPKKNWPKNKEA